MWSVNVLLLATLTAARLVRVDDRPDYGDPNYSCPANLMAPSKSVPKSVHSLRPADIKVVMALGDSITAGNGAGAHPGDALEVLLQYRGLTFAAGGQGNLSNHASIPNILKLYNPNLFGYSLGTGSTNVWEVAQLNSAVPGAHAHDLSDQIRDVHYKLLNHPDKVNFAEDWKLLNIFIGGNDMCSACHDGETPALWTSQIKDAIQYAHDNIPRTIVSLTAMLQLQMLRQIDSGQFFCLALHTGECSCESNSSFTNPEIQKTCLEYANDEIKLMTDGIFDDKDDFTLVVQPFMRDIDTPPMINGTRDLRFFAPDCFHFSQYGHALTSTWLWKNMLEPVNQKTTQGNLSAPATLPCPDPSCPFIRTTKNSQNCATFMTPSAL